MSQVFVPSSGGGLTSPVAIVDGGTGQTTSQDAMVALSSTLFQVSAVNVNWGNQTVTPPLGIPDTAANQAAILDLISILEIIGVLTP